ANLDTERFGPAAQPLAVLRMKLFRRPADDPTKLFWDRVGLRARHLGQHRRLAIALDELDGNLEIPQTSECLPWQRARNHIASNHYVVYFRSTNMLQHGFQCRQVPVNIINGRNAHGRPSSLTRVKPNTLVMTAYNSPRQVLLP